ncbi:sensor histidine kinase [Lapidilactobacillus bayanensis]|uniref:sensor histidine kinase n=1 Tax=Lapidilactobacillus bayanensis TaxID=2485998 RepID=UPI000F76737C|nr:sensor histidine kinase [Lapidilactobacillus bayanensis]
MNFRFFLRDHLLQICFWLIGLFLLNLLIWLDPSHTLALVNLFYLDLLMVLFLSIFLFILYLNRRRWFQEIDQKIKNPDNILNAPIEDAHTYSEQQIQTYGQTLIDTHRQILNSVVAEQNDQREFIDSWVHDIKVPLAALQLISDDLELDIGEQKYYQLTSEVERINHYVEEVLYYSRLSNFANDYLIAQYDLKAIVNPVIRDNMNYFIHKHIQLKQENLDYTVLTDQKWLDFIIQQIISNSLKYTPDNGTITINVAVTTADLQLQISDNGVGISTADLPRIFEKGFTGENGRNADTHATGLGLYLAAKLAKKLGHSLSATSEVGVGTTITIHFPTLSYYNSPGSKQRLQP